MKRHVLWAIFGLGACAVLPQTDSQAAVALANDTCIDAFGPQPDFGVANWHVGVIGTEWVVWTGTANRSDCDYIVQISMTDRSVGLGCLVCLPDAL